MNTNEIITYLTSTSFPFIGVLVMLLTLNNASAVGLAMEPHGGASYLPVGFNNGRIRIGYDALLDEEKRPAEISDSFIDHLQEYESYLLSLQEGNVAQGNPSPNAEFDSPNSDEKKGSSSIGKVSRRSLPKKHKFRRHLKWIMNETPSSNSPIEESPTTKISSYQHLMNRIDEIEKGYSYSKFKDQFGPFLGNDSPLDSKFAKQIQGEDYKTYVKISEKFQSKKFIDELARELIDKLRGPTPFAIFDFTEKDFYRILGNQHKIVEFFLLDGKSPFFEMSFDEIKADKEFFENLCAKNCYPYHWVFMKPGTFQYENSQLQYFSRRIWREMKSIDREKLLNRGVALGNDFYRYLKNTKFDLNDGKIASYVFHGIEKALGFTKKLPESLKTAKILRKLKDFKGQFNCQYDPAKDMKNFKFRSGKKSS